MDGRRIRRALRGTDCSCAPTKALAVYSLDNGMPVSRKLAAEPPALASSKLTIPPPNDDGLFPGFTQTGEWRVSRLCTSAGLQPSNECATATADILRTRGSAESFGGASSH